MLFSHSSPKLCAGAPSPSILICPDIIKKDELPRGDAAMLVGLSLHQYWKVGCE